MFSGVITALVTPFKDGVLDEDAFRNIIDHQFANGVSGVVPCGTTGESPTLSYDEHKRVVEMAVEFTARRGLVIAGTGANSVDEAVELTQAAEQAGADASLQVAPYYNKPSQEGVFQHFCKIAESTRLPIMLYSIPGRCGIEIGVETTARLHRTCPNIVAIKEAGGTPERVSQLLEACGPTLEVLSGDDSLTLPFMSVGAVGVVSVASNLIPNVMSELVAKALAGDFSGARKLHQRYYRLFAAFLKLDVNPVPIKTAMALRGWCELELRLPLVEMPIEKKGDLKNTLHELGIL
ncbi:MAG: 4-hydroxy-tetrahydrodipicolinate synthase [Verrucomicrobiales bacterium]|nr:4-hydroxy-tetrahydrodipicolinate synthase [Verrucomicrobiales bacterium]